MGFWEGCSSSSSLKPVGFPVRSDGIIALVVLAVSVLVLDLIDFLDRFDAVEVTLDGGCLAVNLVEREALVGVGPDWDGRRLDDLTVRMSLLG